jgi:hypothetical protein
MARPFGPEINGQRRNAMPPIERLGTLVWDTIAELPHLGETTLAPDSAIELRKLAYAATGVKAGDDPLLVSGKKLAFAMLEHLQGLTPFDAVKSASRERPSRKPLAAC